MWDSKLTKYQLSQKQTIVLRSAPKKVEDFVPHCLFDGNFLT